MERNTFPACPLDWSSARYCIDPPTPDPLAVTAARTLSDPHSPHAPSASPSSRAKGDRGCREHRHHGLHADGNYCHDLASAMGLAFIRQRSREMLPQLVAHGLCFLRRIAAALASEGACNIRPADGASISTALRGLDDPGVPHGLLAGSRVRGSTTGPFRDQKLEQTPRIGGHLLGLPAAPWGLHRFPPGVARHDCARDCRGESKPNPSAVQELLLLSDMSTQSRLIPRSSVASRVRAFSSCVYSWRQALRRLRFSTTNSKRRAPSIARCGWSEGNASSADNS